MKEHVMWSEGPGEVRPQAIPAYFDGNPYPGRGIVVGTASDGGSLYVAYFIMGRSENSRNRVFALDDDVVRTRPFDDSKVEDASLIIYRAVVSVQLPNASAWVVTNGDHTDTVVAGLTAGTSFEDALMTRRFEPDAPNLTPRISALIAVPSSGDTAEYQMSILKAADPEGRATQRFFYRYELLPGFGHTIHTYLSDGTPLPSFVGEPRPLLMPQSFAEFGSQIWQSLNAKNKISLYTLQIGLSGQMRGRVIEQSIVNTHVKTS
ncbi:MAG: IMP cyclohydrolase [Actinomycetaceae bacterium]|nr:IMP cyclohydrolase [Actinomycetaceae bacterium]MDY6083352.1 IMP cyclohydrolase [Actinomycetaceae bacterium]